MISSSTRMSEDEDWSEGQRGLATEVTGEDALISWEKVQAPGWVCEGDGKTVCEESVKKLLKA